MKLFTCFAFTLLMLLLHHPMFANSTSTESSKFIRMNLEVGESQVRLIRASIHSGLVNPRRLALELRSDHFSLRVMSDQGEILFEDTLQDPRVQFYDEPDLTGRLHGGIIRNNVGIATVTLPFFKNSRSVDFFQRLRTDDENNIHSYGLQSFGTIPIEEITALMRTGSATPAIAPVKIQKTGKPENRIDMVFLAEGYTAEQRASFLKTVRKIVANWKVFLPWSQYFRLLNIYAVPLVSQESGSDHPSLGINRDTVLDSTYDCFGVSYLICIDYDKAFAAAAESVPVFDFAIAVVNDPEYGGSGGPVSVFSVHRDAKQIFFHEIAHTYASLADEYETPEPNPPPFNEHVFPNVTKIRNRNTVKWKAWIDPDTPIPTPHTLQDVIGIFQGAFFHPRKYFRPKVNCLMRTLGVPFDSVCVEAHMLKAFELVSFADTRTPATNNVVLTRNNSETFKVKPAPLPVGRLEFEWFLDGMLQDSRDPSLTLSGNQLTVGDHQVMLRIIDTTPLVRTDPGELRTESFTWNVIVR